MPVAENTSGSSGASFLLGDSARAPSPMSPPAAIAPGPAGLGVAFFPPVLDAFDALGAFGAGSASSSASRRAFSALRAISARRFSSLSSAFLAPFLGPSSHLDASLLSFGAA